MEENEILITPGLVKYRVDEMGVTLEEMRKDIYSYKNNPKHKPFILNEKIKRFNTLVDAHEGMVKYFQEIDQLGRYRAKIKAQAQRIQILEKICQARGVNLNDLNYLTTKDLWT